MPYDDEMRSAPAGERLAGGRAAYAVPGFEGERFAAGAGAYAAAGAERERAVAEAWLVSLRRSLDVAQGHLAASQAARELGCCTRTLQRHLHHVGTTFRAEVKAARGRSRAGG